MATTYKILGQVAPNATTETAVYTVPSSTAAVVSSFVICNRQNASATYRVAVHNASVSVDDENYIVYDSSIPANDTIILTIGMTLKHNERITVFASTDKLSFTAFGSELDA